VTYFAVAFAASCRVSSTWDSLFPGTFYVACALTTYVLSVQRASAIGFSGAFYWLKRN
jgi:hypothetical protein